MTTELNGYTALYKGKRVEVHAHTTADAQGQAAKIFKARKAYDVAVVLAQRGDTPITHNPAILN